MQPDTHEEEPLRLFERWLAEARAGGVPEPGAVAFVTAGKDGRPSARTVLLKRVEDDALLFTSALWTRKAREIQANPQVALLLYWPVAPHAWRRNCPASEQVRDAEAPLTFYIHCAIERGRLMQLEVVGAGLGRTGTMSLKKALEQLTGGRCYHMTEVLQQPASIDSWHAVARGESDDLDALLVGYTASVDWPAAAYWRELSTANPDAIVLLSSRSTPETWWASMEKTIIHVMTIDVPPENQVMAAHRAMALDLFERRFTPNWREPEAAMAAYERHNERVRSEVPPDRLVDWQPGDGWEPICDALGVAAPAEPFPHENSSEEFRGRVDSGPTA
ncbi:MAG: sulfotransferase [Solirubrobacteraceae bacterium]